MYALDGIKVTDLSAYIAGSYCATLLADMGADVVKFETPGGEPFRMMAGAFMGWNRGKRDVVVDMRTQEGKEIVYKSVASSDLFLENFRPGTTERLGMDYETIRKIKPDIVYVSLLGHGSAGPYRTF
ncbi:MAG: CoA transferase, partial [Chloroflexota bacterium]|nr:CoA transferase [Chloroflexota bacterium]